MGLLFSRSSSSSTSSLNRAIIDRDQRLQQLQERKHKQNEQRRWLVRQIIFWAGSAYVLVMAAVYLVEFPPPYHRKFYKLLPLVCLPFLIVAAKQLVDCVWARRLARTDMEIARIEETISDLVNKLDADEEFKKAAQLLNQYATPMKKNNKEQQSSNRNKTQTYNNTPIPQSQPQSQAQSQSHSHPPSHVPSHSRSRVSPSRHRSPVSPLLVQPVGPPAPRSNFDKFVDFILSDGVNNKYALICQQCLTHNGLIQESQIANIAFKCGGCGFINRNNKNNQTNNNAQQHNQAQAHTQPQQHNQNQNQNHTKIPSQPQPHSTDPATAQQQAIKE